MGKRPLKLHDFRRILSAYGVYEIAGGGKGSHIKFAKDFEDGRFTYPVPDRNDVKDCYVRGARKKFRLTPEDGVSDDEFFAQ